MPARTSAVSAICGTHLGDTKAPASITGNPVSDSRSISSTLTASGTMAFSFWSPSRGPTSTIFTRPGSAMSCLLEDDQFGAVLDLIADGVADLPDPPFGGSLDGVLHLHRLHDDQRLTLGNVSARLGQHRDDAARHRGDQLATRSFCIFRTRQRLDQGQAVAAALVEHRD